MLILDPLVVVLQVVILWVSDCQGGRAGWEDSSEDLHHLHHLHHLQQHRILAEPSHQIEVRYLQSHSPH